MILKKLFRKSPKNVFPDVKHSVEPCFKVAGRQYYKFTDLLNTPYERALSALVYYREVDMNIDREFLQKHLDTINDLLLASKIDIYRIKGLNDQLRQRLNLPKSPELLWKLASIIYFDADENPITYDWKYAQKKIDFWKEHCSLNDFFLQQPVIELLPYLRHAGNDLNEFGTLMEVIDQRHQENLSTLSFLKQKTKSSV